MISLAVFYIIFIFVSVKVLNISKHYVYVTAKLVLYFVVSFIFFRTGEERELTWWTLIGNMKHSVTHENHIEKQINSEAQYWRDLYDVEK